MPKFMLLQNYEGGDCDLPMSEWSPTDIKFYLDDHLIAERTPADLLDSPLDPYVVAGQGVAENHERVEGEGQEGDNRQGEDGQAKEPTRFAGCPRSAETRP